MSHALTALSAALPLASGWAVHGLRMHRRYENARRDPLSNLWTRDAFEEQATRILTQHPHVAVVLVDLDGFKAVNDTHGHAAGDAVIRATGASFTDALSGPRRSVAGRIGGDEFAAAVALPAPAALPWLLGGLHGEITAPLHHDGRDLTVGASIGAALSSDAPEEPARELSALLRRADEQMYRTKQEGGGWSIAPAPGSAPGLRTVNGRREGRPGTTSGTGAAA
ncbi:GGDEF domain-containing protein [Streptomyces sp. AM 2-1-1]|uniref:GGDEF domain-containing protein n=1 Tax=Streptomyces sp. AM 2-1-1 TaxID=3028709 RepID=UPI0023B92C58|nr:GGDEF domain-containing protein [Streptomyces sp. AM 2-1-1]WEH40917.1 GGDEF domain-containing protein [Streptomyces sp. AM 2-1-1]